MKHQQPISLGSIRFSDGLISRMQRLVHDTVLPYQWEVLHDRVAGATPSHCIENFRIAAGLSSGTYYGMPFQDSDLYKWLEAVGYALEILGAFKECETCPNKDICDNQPCEKEETCRLH